MLLFRRGSFIALISLLLLSVTGVTASARVRPDPVDKSRGATKSLPPRADGLIVKTTGRTPSTKLLARTDALLRGKAATARVLPGAKDTNSIVLSGDVSAATASSVAASLQKEEEVVWAAPNYRRQLTDNAPAVGTNDPRYGDQISQWDPRTGTDALVHAVFGSHPYQRGGYSMKTPDIWQKTKGASTVVVAVLDTGITAHPDLAGQTVPGYDMVSTSFVSNDGDGRDSNPADPGDWVTAGECEDGSPAENSSWHGTHVSGIIAAKGDNGIGISGIAPNVKIQPIRVLGRCGGYDADIVDGIRWAAGGTISGVPTNPTPAKVINLSLSGETPCTQPYIDAVDYAQSHGAVVVVAAGNNDDDASKYAPGNCPNATTVAATDEFGFRASYSNFGPGVDISAPGGDFSYGTQDRHGIVSTVNLGTTTPLGSPAGAGYAAYEGTSMATPAVSAALAIMSSFGFSSATIRTALSSPSLVEPPTTVYDTANAPDLAQWVCQVDQCGTGILDFSTWRVPLSAPVIQGLTGAPVVGQSLQVQVNWLKLPDIRGERWSRNGTPFLTSYHSQLVPGYPEGPYVVTAADWDTVLSATAFGHAIAAYDSFPDMTAGTVTTQKVLARSTLTLTPATIRPVFGRPLTVRVAVATQPATTASGQVSLSSGSTIVATGNVTSGVVTLAIPADAVAVGSHVLTATYAGGPRVAGVKSGPTTIVVGKAPATLSQSFADSTITRSTSARSTVRIRVVGVARPTGTVKVYDGSKLLKSYPMYASYLGVHTYTLPRITRAGKHSITWTYSGNRDIRPATAGAKTLTVR